MTIEQPSDGGPAFPGEIDTIMFHPEGKVEPQTIAARQRGMSLRDYFAAKAIEAAIVRNAHWGQDVTSDCVAEFAYRVADAMLAEREK